MFKRSFSIYGAAALLLTYAGGALCASATGAPGIEGIWQGVISVEGDTMRLAIEVSKGGNGALAGSVISVDQSGKKLPADAVTFKDHKLHMEVRAAHVQYDGTLNDAGSAVTGTWQQGSHSLPLNLKRDSNIPVVRRPQEPQRPYPYREEEVSYENAEAAGVRLAGTLTLPKGTGPFPVALLITGSGPQDRDEALLGHKPFLILSDYLTRRGIAVLRVDDRGVGASTGNFSKATSADFATDVMAGVRFLKGRSDIQHNHIGLIGHSEGGLIGPLVATQSPDVAFVVMMAGPGVLGETLMLKREPIVGQLEGIPEGEVHATFDIQRQMMALLRREPDPKKAEPELKKLAADELAKLPVKYRADLAPTMPAQIEELNSPWMRYFLAYDPAPTLRRVKCPVLAINGDLDVQVLSKLNLAGIDAALKAGGNKDYMVRELPRLNHFFQTATTGSPAEYQKIDETLSPVALQTMGDWIVAHVGALKGS